MKLISAVIKPFKLEDVRQALAEAGVQGMVIYTWTGLFGPTGIPRPIVGKLHAEAVKAIAAPAVKERFAAEGAEPVGSTPAEFAVHVRNELKRWADVTKAAGISLE